VAPHITRYRFGLASRCTNLVDQDRKLGSGEGLSDAGGCAMPSNDRSRLCFINFCQRDHRWCTFRVIQRLKDRHTVKARVDIDNREIDIIQAETEDFECLSGGTRLSHAASCFFCRFRDGCVQVLTAIGHEQNIPSHTNHLSAAIEIDLSALANFSAKIAVKNLLQGKKTDFSLPHFQPSPRRSVK